MSEYSEAIRNKIALVREELKILTSANTLVISLANVPKGGRLPLGALHGNVWIDVLGADEYLTIQQYLALEGCEVVKQGLAPCPSASGRENFYIVLEL